MARYACTMPVSMHFWDTREAMHCLPDGAALRPGGNKPILSSSEAARTSQLLSLVDHVFLLIYMNADKEHWLFHILFPSQSGGGSV